MLGMGETQENVHNPEACLDYSEEEVDPAQPQGPFEQDYCMQAL